MREPNHPETAESLRRRLFVALTLDGSTRDELERVQGLLLPDLAHPHLTSRHNLHLTLVFLGEQTLRQEADATRAMRAATRAFADAGGTSFRLSLGDLGCFERRSRSVVWMGLRRTGSARAGYGSLMKLQALLEAELVLTGLKTERRPFRPHITLARGCRVAPGTDERSMEDLLLRRSREFGLAAEVGADEKCPSFGVDGISLMWSHHPAGGALAYSELSRCSL